MIRSLIVLCLFSAFSQARGEANIHSNPAKWLVDQGVSVIDRKEWLELNYEDTSSRVNSLVTREFQKTGMKFAIVLNPNMMGFPSDQYHLLSLDRAYAQIAWIQEGKVRDLHNLKAIASTCSLFED